MDRRVYDLPDPLGPVYRSGDSVLLMYLALEEIIC